MQMRREEQPSWLGPAVAGLLILIVAGLVWLVYVTVFHHGEGHGDEAGAGAARPADVRVVAALPSWTDTRPVWL
jgi:hypothetical protein